MTYRAEHDAAIYSGRRILGKLLEKAELGAYEKLEITEGAVQSSLASHLGIASRAFRDRRDDTHWRDSRRREAGAGVVIIA